VYWTECNKVPSWNRTCEFITILMVYSTDVFSIVSKMPACMCQDTARETVETLKITCAYSMHWATYILVWKLWENHLKDIIIRKKLGKICCGDAH
jgi:hypothetical protein